MLEEGPLLVPPLGLLPGLARVFLLAVETAGVPGGSPRLLQGSHLRSFIHVGVHAW